MLLFLQLYLAHLVADFLLQPDWVSRRKTEIRPLAAHAAIHLVCAAAAVNVGLDRRVAGAIVSIALIHTLLDYAKARLSGDGWIAFTADQAAHVLLFGVDDFHGSGLGRRRLSCRGQGHGGRTVAATSQTDKHGGRTDHPNGSEVRTHERHS